MEQADEHKSAYHSQIKNVVKGMAPQIDLINNIKEERTKIKEECKALIIKKESFIAERETLEEIKT